MLNTTRQDAWTTRRWGRDTPGMHKRCAPARPPPALQQRVRDRSCTTDWPVTCTDDVIRISNVESTR